MFGLDFAKTPISYLSFRVKCTSRDSTKPATGAVPPKLLASRQLDCIASLWGRTAGWGYLLEDTERQPFGSAGPPSRNH